LSLFPSPYAAARSGQIRLCDPILSLLRESRHSLPPHATTDDAPGSHKGALQDFTPQVQTGRRPVCFVCRSLRPPRFKRGSVTTTPRINFRVLSQDYFEFAQKVSTVSIGKR